VPVDLTPAPQSIYETSKHVVERLVVRARARLDLEAAAMRLATTWGPGKSGASHGAFSAHSDVVAAAAAGRSTRLDAPPDQGFDLVYYADIAAGLVAAALSEAPLRRPVYHIGSGRIVTAAQFAAGVEAMFPGVRVDVGDRFPATRNCLLDVGPAREDFGYEPAWDLAKALSDARSRLRA
jgi:nucleoside-diphosphate-sugar epimerase